MIRDIIMYICAPIGLFCIGYVRVSYSSRYKKNPTITGYDEKEKKIRTIGIVFLVIALALAAIPAKYVY